MLLHRVLSALRFHLHRFLITGLKAGSCSFSYHSRFLYFYYSGLGWVFDLNHILMLSVFNEFLKKLNDKWTYLLRSEQTNMISKTTG